MTLEFSAALFGIYGFSDMKYVFYSVLKTALQLSDWQLGMIWGAFGGQLWYHTSAGAFWRTG